MYEKKFDTRTYHLGAQSGIIPELVSIFTSRIPKDYVTISPNGKERHRDGDNIILPILDRLYDLKGLYSPDDKEVQNLSLLYHIKNDKRALSYERFVLLEILRQVFPKEKASISEKIVRFPKDVNLLTIEDSEVLALYNWIIC